MVGLATYFLYSFDAGTKLIFSLFFAFKFVKFSAKLFHVCLVKRYFLNKLWSRNIYKKDCCISQINIILE